MRSVLLVSYACGIFGTMQLSAWAFDNEPGSHPKMAPRGMRVDMKSVDSQGSAAELGRKRKPNDRQLQPSSGVDKAHTADLSLPTQEFRVRHITAKRFVRPFSPKTLSRIDKEVTDICRRLAHCPREQSTESHIAELEKLAKETQVVNEERRERAKKTAELISIDEKTSEIDQLRDRLNLLKWQMSSDSADFVPPDPVYKSPGFDRPSQGDIPLPTYFPIEFQSGTI